MHSNRAEGDIQILRHAPSKQKKNAILFAALEASVRWHRAERESSLLVVTCTAHAASTAGRAMDGIEPGYLH